MICPICGMTIEQPIPGLRAWCPHCRHIVDPDDLEESE